MPKCNYEKVLERCRYQEQMMYCKSGYFGEKQIKYIGSEQFTDSFGIMAVFCKLPGTLIKISSLC